MGEAGRVTGIKERRRVRRCAAGGAEQAQTAVAPEGHKARRRRGRGQEELEVQAIKSSGGRRRRGVFYMTAAGFCEARDRQKGSYERARRSRTGLPRPRTTRDRHRSPRGNMRRLGALLGGASARIDNPADPDATRASSGRNSPRPLFSRPAIWATDRTSPFPPWEPSSSPPSPVVLHKRRPSPPPGPERVDYPRRPIPIADTRQRVPV